MTVDEFFALARRMKVQAGYEPRTKMFAVYKGTERAPRVRYTTRDIERLTEAEFKEAML